MGNQPFCTRFSCSKISLIDQKEEKAKLQKIKKTEEDIAKSEENLEKLQESLCLEEVYSNPEESIRVNKEIKDLEAHIEELYATWESLSE